MNKSNFLFNNEINNIINIIIIRHSNIENIISAIVISPELEADKIMNSAITNKNEHIKAFR